MFKLVKNELLVVWKLMIIYTILLAMLVSIIVSVISLSQSALQQIPKIADEQTNGYNVRIYTSYKDINKLYEIGADNISVNIIEHDLIENSAVILYKAKGVDAVKGKIISTFTNDDSGDNENFDRFESLSKNEPDDCNRHGIWLSFDFARQHEISINEILTLQIGTTNLPDAETIGLQFVVKGLYQQTDDDFIIYAGAAIDLLDKSALSTDYTITSYFKSYERCKKFINTLNSKQYKYNSLEFEQTEKRVNNLYLLFFALLSFCVILTVITVALVLSYLNILILKRQKHIGLLRMLGVTTTKVAALYYTIAEVTLLMATALSVIGSRTIFIYAIESYQSIFNENLIDFKYFEWSPLLSFFILNVFMLGVILYIKSAIKRIKPIDFIKEQ